MQSPARVRCVVQELRDDVHSFVTEDEAGIWIKSQWPDKVRRMRPLYIVESFIAGKWYEVCSFNDQFTAERFRASEAYRLQYRVRCYDLPLQRTHPCG